MAEYTDQEIDALIEKVADAGEKMVHDLKDQNVGALRTLFNLAADNLSFSLARGKVSDALGIETDGKGQYEIWAAIVEKAQERGHPSAERLQNSKDWNDRFWSQDEVKRLEKANTYHVFRHVNDMKALANNFE